MRDAAMRDYALHLAAAVADSLANGEQPPDEVEVHPPFPPAFGPDERFWAAGPYRLQAYCSLGDGSYEYGTFVAGGFSPLGLLTFFGTLGLSAANKRRARREAEWAAMPRWHDVDSGTVAVTRYGMYLHSTRGVFGWDWHRITAADLVEPGVLEFSGESGNGHGSWRLVSDWAELAFATWAITCHPRHPRFASGGWLPPGRPAVIVPSSRRQALP